MKSRKYPKLKTLLNESSGQITIGESIFGWVVSILPQGVFDQDITGQTAQGYANSIIRLDYGNRELSTAFEGIDETQTPSAFSEGVIKSLAYKHIDKWVHQYAYAKETYDLTETGYTEQSTGASTTGNTITGTNTFYGFNSNTAKNHDGNSTTSSGSINQNASVTRTEHNRLAAEVFEKDRAFWEWSFLDTMIHDVINEITISIY